MSENISKRIKETMQIPNLMVPPTAEIIGIKDEARTMLVSSVSSIIISVSEIVGTGSHT